MEILPGTENSVINYDELSGVGIWVAAWGTDDRHFVGLTFATALEEHAHDLTVGQARQLRDALIRALGGVG